MVRERNFTAVLVAMALAIFPLLYVASYLVLVEPVREIISNSAGNWEVAEPHYGGVHSRASVAAFWPVHAADRLVRRELWMSRPIDFYKSFTRH